MCEGDNIMHTATKGLKYSQQTLSHAHISSSHHGEKEWGWSVKERNRKITG